MCVASCFTKTPGSLNTQWRALSLPSGNNQEISVCVLCLINSQRWSLPGLKHVSLEQPLISDYLSPSEDQGCTLTHQGSEPGQCYLCAGIKVPVFASRSILSTNLGVIITPFLNSPLCCKINVQHWKCCCHTLNSPVKAKVFKYCHHKQIMVGC